MRQWLCLHYYEHVYSGQGLLCPATNRRGIKRRWCLSVWRLSVCRVHRGLSREQRGLGRLKLAQRQPTSHVIRTPLSRSKVKGQGHQAALVGCSSHYIIYMDDTIIYATAHSEPLPVDHEYSWRKVRWAPQA